jgi:hypothetical protein
LVFGGGEWVCEDGKSVYQLPVFLWSFEKKKLMGWASATKVAPKRGKDILSSSYSSLQRTFKYCSLSGADENWEVKGTS